MATDRTLRSGVASLVLLLSLIATPLLASGAVGAQEVTRSADLHIDQPHYIDDSVSVQSNNGTQLYEARGTMLTITPQNFAGGDVVDYGVVTTNATLSYEEDTGAFTFDPQGTGTYRLRFVVAEPLENGTGTHRVTYEADVRVTGGMNLVHQQRSSIEQREEDAQNWREFNSTLQNQGLIDSGGIEFTLEEMVNWYKLHPTNDPLSALTGGVVGYIIIGVTTTSVLVWVFFFGGHTFIVRKLRREKHIHESIEAEEGTAKQAIAELDRKLDQQTLQNMDWQDIDGFDDHIAGAFREAYGETVGDGAVEYLSMMLPRNLVDDRLQAMGQDGWRVVLSDPAPDGGDGETTATADLYHSERDAVALEDASGEVIDPSEADTATRERIREVLDWNDDALRSFSLPRAEYDVSDLETRYDSMDLEELVRELKVDMTHFSDREAFGQYMREFLAAVERSPFCDDEGRPDELRYVMSRFLKLTQVLDDRFDFPLVRMHREAWERALIDFDPEQEAIDKMREVELGAQPRGD